MIQKLNKVSHKAPLHYPNPPPPLTFIVSCVCVIQLNLVKNPEGQLYKGYINGMNWDYNKRQHSFFYFANGFALH